MPENGKHEYVNRRTVLQTTTAGMLSLPAVSTTVVADDDDDMSPHSGRAPVSHEYDKFESDEAELMDADYIGEGVGTRVRWTGSYETDGEIMHYFDAAVSASYAWRDEGEDWELHQNIGDYTLELVNDGPGSLLAPQPADEELLAATQPDQQGSEYNWAEGITETYSVIAGSVPVVGGLIDAYSIYDAFRNNEDSPEGSGSTANYTWDFTPDPDADFPETVGACCRFFTLSSIDETEFEVIVRVDMDTAFDDSTGENMYIGAVLSRSSITPETTESTQISNNDIEDPALKDFADGADVNYIPPNEDAIEVRTEDTGDK